MVTASNSNLRKHGYELLFSCRIEDLTTVATLLILKLIVWDRWNVSIPLQENWNMLKQIGSFQNSNLL